MSEHDVESLLAELKPATLSTNADADILAAIRAAQSETEASEKLPRTPARVYSVPVPAWAAAAACLVVGTGAWLAGARTRPATDSRMPIEIVPYSTTATPSPVHRVHVETDVFAATPRRSLDVYNWSPQAATPRENRS